jgi:DNA-binding CsgD family transcriptional regulator
VSSLVERPIGRARPATITGRDHERQALARALDTLSSAATSVVVTGEAGQGKSALLRWLARSARNRGFTVLRATGVEFERGLAFSGLTAVLRPLQDRIDALDEGPRLALRAALGLAPGEAPVLTTYAATLSLLSLAAEAAPVVVVVDDAHWLDRASLEALVFAAHRAGADRLGFVFAQRTGRLCLIDQTAFERVDLHGLSPAEATELLAGEHLVPAVAERCWELTGGNPLALTEAARALSPAQRAGDAPLPPALPVGHHLLDAFRERLRDLPEATVRALTVAALDADGDMAVVAPALAALGLGSDDLAAAERHDVVALDTGQVTWRHPLLRSAVYQLSDRPGRRPLHRALADAASAAGLHHQAVWHLSESVVGPDDDVAARLAELAADARRRGALPAAADAYEQAARLSTTAAASATHLRVAGGTCWTSGDAGRAAGLLGAALARSGDPAARAETAVVLGQVEMWLAGPAAGVARFGHHADEVAETRPDLAAALLLHATTADLLALAPDAAVSRAEQAAAAAERAGDPAAVLATAAMRTITAAFAGRDPAAPAELEPIGRLALAALADGVEGASDLAQLCAYGLSVCERWSPAAELLGRVIHRGEGGGMLGQSIFARSVLAELLWRTGRWAEGLAELTQSLSLQEAAGQRQLVPCTMAVLARVEAGLGRAESCRDHARQAIDGAEALHIDQFAVHAHSALGLLELGAGRHAEAARAFDQVAATAGHVPEPGWLWWQADAVEAYAACGRADDAGRLLDRLEAQAAATGRGWAGAAAERAAGLLGRGDPPDDRFGRALDGFRTAGIPFEEARTLLARAEHRLRRGARSDGARDAAAARTIFDRLGARAWSERASQARGEAGGADDSLASRLTPAELRVALAVGQGASNREAAERLFISVKTVDYHLQSTYRKLGLRSRTQLAALVLADASSRS